MGTPASVKAAPSNDGILITWKEPTSGSLPTYCVYHPIYGGRMFSRPVGADAVMGPLDGRIE